MMKITVYGDSIMKGVLLQEGKYIISHAWQEQLAEAFDLEIVNHSRFGCTIQKGMARIEKDCATPCAQAEYALVEFGGNDCDFDWAAISEQPDAPHICKTPPEQFTDCCRRAVRLLRGAGRIPVLASLPPICAQRYFDFFCRGGLSRENILRWLGDVERIYRWQEYYSHLVERLAREERTAFVDLRTPFLTDTRAVTELLCEDGIHPSREGQELLRAAFADALQKSTDAFARRDIA